MPSAVNHLVRDAVTSRLVQIAMKPVGEAERKNAALAAFLAASCAYGESLELSTKERLLCELVVLGHHYEICTSFQDS